MEPFTERLQTLPDLSDEELDGLETEMIAAFDAADQSGDVDLMQALADGLDEVRAEKSRRTETAAPPAEAPAEVAASAAPTEDAGAQTPAATEAVAATGFGAETPEAQVNPPTGSEQPPAPQPEPQPTEPQPGEPQPEPQPAPAPEPQPEPEPAPAPEPAPEEPQPQPEPGQPEEQPASEPDSGESEAETEEAPPAESESEESGDTQVEIEVTASEVPDENTPVTSAAERPMTILAGGDLPGYTAGSELANMDQVAEAFAAKVNSIRGIAGDGEHILVASIRNRGDASEAQTLSASDPIGNQRKIRDLLSDPHNLTREALTAAGWCAPPVPIYDIPGIGSTDRPVGSSIPTFNADRGGIVFTRPPVLRVPTAGEPGGVGIYKADGTNWTMVNGTLTALTDPTLKPCLDVDCGEPGTAELHALSLCLCFSNLHARAYPEWIRSNTDYALVMQARLAEEYVLSMMIAASTSVGAAGTTVLGTARDTIRAIRVAAAEFRWLNRISPESPVSVVLPAWVRDAIAADLNFQAPGDLALETSWADVDGYFGEFNVDVAWSLDNLSPAWTSKQQYPSTFTFIMYATGSFLRLDGGSLDLGVVRTKEDIQTNRYCTFTETFEEVAYIGPESAPGDGTWSYTGTLAVKTKGGVGAAVAVT